MSTTEERGWSPQQAGVVLSAFLYGYTATQSAGGVLTARFGGKRVMLLFTLAGAGLIGFLQKGIEWLNPSNTLAAQTYMILFIILFIQFRPKGIVAPKGRAAAD